MNEGGGLLEVDMFNGKIVKLFKFFLEYGEVIVEKRMDFFEIGEYIRVFL